MNNQTETLNNKKKQLKPWKTNLEPWKTKKNGHKTTKVQTWTLKNGETKYLTDKQTDATSVFYGFSWFQVGFSWFQVGFHGFAWKVSFYSSWEAVRPFSPEGLKQ